MKISAIAAIGENRELGANNSLLWNIPGELKRFKEITTGHPIIMGRKTFESIGRILPNRTNIIITRDDQYKVNEALIFHSINHSIQRIRNQKLPGSEEIFIIGGGQIFKEALPLIDRLYLTLVHKSFPEADVFFPEYKNEFAKIVEKHDMPKINDIDFSYSFLTLERD